MLKATHKKKKSSGKKNKGKARKNHRRQRGQRNHNIQEFWLDFNDCISRETRLYMLKEMAKKAYKVSSVALDERAKTMRGYWDERKNKYFRLRDQRCGACYDPATVRHHIVPLANGGGNHGMNLIPLCDTCHAEIHPWMKK